MTAHGEAALPGSLAEALELAADGPAGVRFFARDNTVGEHAYEDLARDAALLAAALRARGIQKGDCVALVQSTSYDLIRSLYGVLYCGAVPVCLATPRMGRMADYKPATIRMLQTAKARLVVTEEKTRPGLLKVIDELALSCVTPEELAPPAGNTSGGLRESMRPEEPALIQFSSGTTMAPKPIVLTHGNIMHNTRAILAALPGNSWEHSGCSWLPLHHDMGLIGGLFSAVTARGSMTFLKPEDFIARPGLWPRALSESRATICPAPNFALQVCVDRVREEEIPELDLSNWSIALIGAETVREDTLRRFADRFAGAGFRYESFTPVYGLAEATLAVAFSEVPRAPLSLRLNRSELAEGRVVQDSDAAGATVVMSVGRPLRDVEIRIRDENGRDLGENRVGRIHVSGPLVMKGYLDRPEETRAVVRDGFLDTGDLGFLVDGELYIHGRERDIIILNGRNYDPRDIEFAADEIEELDHDRAAAVPVQDERRGTEGFVFLVEKSKGRVSEPDALALRAREAVITATGLIPELVGIVETARLPRTTSGKIRRGRAREMYLAGDFELLGKCER